MKYGMMKIVGMLVVVSLLVSCNLFDDRNTTIPEVLNENEAFLRASFSAGEASVAADFEAATTDKGSALEFSVEAGDYLYEYVTNLGHFYVVFRALKAATIQVGLQPGDQFHSDYINYGTIKSTATRLATSGPVEIYSWPTEQKTWPEIFSTEELYTYGFTARLSWTHNVDMDLYIVEPTDEISDPYISGPTSVFVGDNTCGFGSSCDPSACQGLSCNTPEKVVVSYAGVSYYTAWVSNWSTIDEPVTLVVDIPAEAVKAGDAYSVTLNCTIPADTDQPIVDIDLGVTPAIADISSEFGDATCTVAQKLIK